MRTSSTVALAAALVAATNAPPAADRAAMAGADHVSVEGDGIRIEFDHRLHSRVVATLDGAETALGDFRPSESVSLASADALDFTLIGREDDIAQDALGAGRRVTLTGRAGSLRKTVAVTTYANTPGLAVLQVRYTN